MKAGDGFAAHRPTSTDPKPSDAPHGTIIQEDDTKDYYWFDANEKMWTKIGEEFTKTAGKRVGRVMRLTYPSNKICPRCGTGGYVWYLDNSEYVAKCTNCGHYFRREDFPMCGLDEAPKPITNADRIRAMTDEELAEFIEYLTNGCDYMYPKCYASEFCTSGYCRSAWIDWLKQEFEDD